MSDLSQYQGFFNTMSQIQNTGKPVVSNYTSGYVSPADILGMMDLNVGQASLSDIARYDGLGTAAQIGLNRLGTGVSNLLGNTVDGFNNLGIVQGFKGMPATDQLNALAGMATSLNGIWTGYQQNKLMKDQFRFQKDAFNKQYQASVNQYNTSLEDRQRARVASNPNAYQSVSEYMNQHRMK